MNRNHLKAVLALATFAALAGAAHATPLALPWPNGDFELGGAAWTYASTTTFSDADNDGDTEALLAGCGDGTYQISRGVSKGVVPATASLALDVERGQLDVWSIRMIMLDLEDPDAYANNLYYNDPTGTLQPDWNDDQVLAWEDWPGGPLSGSVVLDPAEATGYNIPGWSGMTEDERRAKLATMTHMTLVVYACASGFQGGATLDDLAWVV